MDIVIGDSNILRIPDQYVDFQWLKRYNIIDLIGFDNIQNGKWDLLGNTNGSSNKLGTTDATPLRLFTNDLERVYIEPFNGYVGINTPSPLSHLQTNGSVADSVLVTAASTVLNNTHNKIVCNNGATNITLTLPNALTCLGRRYIVSRGATSTGTITLTPSAGRIQALAGTVGATTSIGVHSATGAGLHHNFTAVNIGGIGTWIRI